MRRRRVSSLRRWWLAPALLVASLGPAVGQQPPAPTEAKPAAPRANTAIKPAPRNGAWKQIHQRLLERTRQGDVDLLFLGDSITAGWQENPVWQKFYGDRKAANFGIGGDRTEHVLWRLENGEGDGLSPKVVVLMIGTNNLGVNKDEEIAEGVKAVVAKLRSKFPAAKVVLLGIFPRGAKRDKTQERTAVEPRVGQINAMISKLGDEKTVFYRDIGDRFLAPDGQAQREIMPDYVHLSLQGYQAWADAIEPTLKTLLTPESPSPTQP